MLLILLYYLSSFFLIMKRAFISKVIKFKYCLNKFFKIDLKEKNVSKNKNIVDSFQRSKWFNFYHKRCSKSYKKDSNGKINYKWGFNE